MNKHISLSDFRNAVINMRPRSFSYNGLEALYNYLEEINPQMELDVIAIDCEFSEFSSAIEAIKDYSGINDEVNTIIKEENERAAREWFHFNTALIEIKSGGIIISTSF